MKRVFGLRTGGVLAIVVLTVLLPLQSGPSEAQTSRDQITIGIPVNPETLDVHGSSGLTTQSLHLLIYDTLLRRDTRTGALQPWLATSYRQVDARTWEFKLRKGVVFHNGEPFDAAVVKANFERMSKKPLTVYYIGGTLAEVRVVDALTVRFITSVPDPIWPSKVAVVAMGMVPAKYVVEVGDQAFASKPVGTGPFKFVEWQAGNQVVMEANGSYWGPKPQVKRLIFKIIPDELTRMAALETGNVDIVTNVPLSIVSRLNSNNSLKVFSKLSSSTPRLTLNVAKKKSPLGDVRVRKALNYAVDRQAIIKQIYQGRAQEYHSFIPKQMDQYVDMGSTYAYDPEKAKRLLAEAGYPNGFEMTLEVPIGRYPGAEDATQVIAGYFNNIGVQTKVLSSEWAAFNRRAVTCDMGDAFYYALTHYVWDADQILNYFVPEINVVYCFQLPDDLMEAVRKQKQILDERTRKQALVEIQRKMWDLAPWVFLYQVDNIFAMRRSVQNFDVRGDDLLDLAQVGRP